MGSHGLACHHREMHHIYKYIQTQSCGEYKQAKKSHSGVSVTECCQSECHHNGKLSPPCGVSPDFFTLNSSAVCLNPELKSDQSPLLHLHPRQ